MTLAFDQSIQLLALCGGMFLLTLLVGFAFSGNDARLRRRLARVRGESGPRFARTAGSLRRAEIDSSFAALDRLIKRSLPNPDKLRARLMRTGRKITAGEYVMMCAVLALFVGVLLFFVFRFPPILSVLIGLIVGLLVPHLTIGMMGNRRVSRFIHTFPEAIDLICRGLRAGLPVSESINAVGQELPDPIGVEFRSVTEKLRLGISLDDAMWDVARRIDAPEFKFLIISMSIQRETGGNLAETLANLAELLRRRRAMKLKIKAMSSEARASALIIGSLPFLMALLLTVLSPDYMTVLFSDPRGLMMIGFGLGMIALGAAVMAKMVNFEI
jgi:tight adherence protein B